MKKGDILTKDKLSNAVLLGSGQISPNPQIPYVELLVYKTRTGHRNLFGSDFFVAGRKPGEVNCRLVEQSNDIIDIMSKRRQLARTASFSFILGSVSPRNNEGK